MDKIKVVVTGATGKMGLEALNTVIDADDLELVGAIDVKHAGMDVGYLVGVKPIGVQVNEDLATVLKEEKPDVMVDFTNPQAVLKNIKTALEHKVSPVVGTTGLTDSELEEIQQESKTNNTSVFIAPNFTIGAVLMMRFAKEAAKYMPHVEVIEQHHDEKLDAPSGTALKTIEMISEEREALRQGNINEYEKIPGCRGGEHQGMRVHSVRLPGLVAHQEVIFGGQGQTLTIRHDSISRDSFRPGIALGIRKVKSLKGVVIGLENLI
ncbi:4-hydroxy-tetrahydrodipicolinate reductase [Desulfitispora alkaliphila]|uniref:4-hydroxy-tetrahydrodipicolinate reductase n=1 Tax=Desulfitispora alkaliphila TaxID=622674 RepID=UPI003D1C1DB6